MIVEDATGIETAARYLSVMEEVSILTDLAPSSTFHSLSAELQEAALKTATIQLDTFFSIGGTIFSTTQSLKCPRQNLYDSEGRLLQGVPRLLKYSVALQADYVSENDWREDLSTDIKKVDIGPISMELSQVGAQSARQKSPITLAASQFMKSFATSIIKSGRRGSTRLVSS